MEVFCYESRSENCEFSIPGMLVNACSILCRADLYHLIGLGLFAATQNGKTGFALCAPSCRIFQTGLLLITGLLTIKTVLHGKILPKQGPAFIADKFYQEAEGGALG
mgnify:CR=1 FL=1